ncbi:MAG: DNA-processing protein DprA [Bacteroidota bacterium]|nr:DNA-processing protein DprA [Bacteroidota bacterium]
MMVYPQKVYEVAIGLIPGIGNSLTRQLISYCGSAENVFKASKVKLKNIPYIGELIADQIVSNTVLPEAQKIVEKAEKFGAEIIFYTDKTYPNVLKHFDDSPSILYFKGNIPLNINKSIAIVGTRQATEYGKEITEKIIKEIAHLNVTIISGLAYGIDIAAHKAALKYGLPTIGIMGSGLDIIYPAIHKSTAMEMIQNGGILTENTFGVKPDAPRFPERNRIIAGLADATIVIEASHKGGALITAEIANSYNKEVYAVPGKIGDNYSSGCNTLIKNNKARILESVEQLIEEMNWLETQPKNKKNIQQKVQIQLEPETQAVYDVLKIQKEIEMDDLAWKTGHSVNKLSSILLNMEFEGLIKPLPGKKFKIVD